MTHYYTPYILRKTQKCKNIEGVLFKKVKVNATFCLKWQRRITEKYFGTIDQKKLHKQPNF